MFGRKDKEPAPEGIVTSDAAQKQTKVDKRMIVPDEETGVSKKRRFRWRRPSKRSALLLFVVLAVIVAVGSFLFFYLQTPEPKNDWQGELAEQSRLREAETVYRGVAGTELSPSQYATAQAKLKDLAEQMTEDKDAAYVYMQMASLSLGANKYQDSLTYSQKAESLRPNAGTARLVAVSAIGLNKNQMAIEYYKKAIARMDPTLETDRTDIALYKLEIKKLGGTP